MVSDGDKGQDGGASTPNSGSSSSLDEAETRALEKCWSDSFWRRAVPVAAVSGSLVLAAISAGKIRPGSARFGPWVRVLGASFLGFWGGKFSYLMGRECQDRFLEMAPEGPIAKSIRERRRGEPETSSPASSLPPPPPGTAGPEDAPDPPSVRKMLEGSTPSSPAGASRPRVQFEGTGVLGADGDKEQIKITTDQGNIVVTLSDREQRILEDCRKVSVYYFSLPLSGVMGAFAYVAQARGFLRESRFFKKPPLNRAPKAFVLGALGYGAGQALYMFSSDCAERFLKKAPHGQMSKAIRFDRLIFFLLVCIETTNNVVHFRMMREGTNADEAGLLPKSPKALPVNGGGGESRRDISSLDPSGAEAYLMPLRPRSDGVLAAEATVEDLLRESLE